MRVCCVVLLQKFGLWCVVVVVSGLKCVAVSENMLSIFSDYVRTVCRTLRNGVPVWIYSDPAQTKCTITCIRASRPPSKQSCTVLKQYSTSSQKTSTGMYDKVVYRARTGKDGRKNEGRSWGNHRRGGLSKRRLLQEWAGWQAGNRHQAPARL